MTLDRDSLLGPFPLPEVDEAMRERARRLAGSERWLTIEDPGAPPEQPEKTRLQGVYEIDDAGELTGNFKINYFYRPSAQVAGMPMDIIVEHKLWLALNGYHVARFLVDTLDRAELALYAEHSGDTRLLVTRDNYGQPILPAFTSSRLLPTSWTHHHLVPGWTIMDQFGDGPVFLDLNPGTPLALKILIRDLAGLLTDRNKESRKMGPIEFDSDYGPIMPGRERE